MRGYNWFDEALSILKGVAVTFIQQLRIRAFLKYKYMAILINNYYKNTDQR
jgi:hypothetical protein